MSLPTAASLARNADASELEYLFKVLYTLPSDDLTIRVDTIKRIVNLCLPLDAGQHTMNQWTTILLKRGNPLDIDRIENALRHALAGRLRLIADSLAPSPASSMPLYPVNFMPPPSQTHYGIPNFVPSGLYTPSLFTQAQQFHGYSSQAPVR